MDTKVTSRASINYTIAVNDLYGNETSVFISSSDMTIEKVKESAIKQLSESESSTNFGQFRLVVINDMPRQLCDDKTIKQERIEDGDCALLVKSRNKQVSSLVKDGVVSHDGPTQSVIARATDDLPALGGTSEKFKQVATDLSSPNQVEQTFRKVLLALLELSYKFMHFEQEERNTKAKVPDIDSDQIKHLVDMGFSEKRAKKALILSNMDQNMAMEWLLSHSEDDSDDEESSFSPSGDEPMDTSSTVFAAGGGMRTRSRTFVPNPAHLSVLMDMGFTKEESIQALRINGNNPNTACDWLLSDRRGDDVMADANDEPLSPDSELYKALISNPTIHIGLHDKKVLEALEDMVENPWRRNNWAYESAVGNVLLQILKLYNKYSTTAPAQS